MKKAIIGITAFCVLAGGSVLGIPHIKKKADNYINTKVQEAIIRYEQEDRQWTKENYEETTSQEQLQTAFNSTYYILNEIFYKTNDGQAIEKGKNSGSGILLNGGYLLTIKHIVGKAHVSTIGSFLQKRLYPHNNFSLMNKTVSDNPKRYELEEIIISENFDYSLLKLKENIDLPCYSYGLNLPDKVELNMQSVAIGFPKGANKNMRSGNVSQTESDLGEEYMTFKNSLIAGDSGGPIFVVKDGNLKLVALSGDCMIVEDPVDPSSIIRHPVNINFGIKISNVVEDLEEKLKSGSLDEKTAKEIENFLKLNKK